MQASPGQAGQLTITGQPHKVKRIRDVSVSKQTAVWKEKNLDISVHMEEEEDY